MAAATRRVLEPRETGEVLSAREQDPGYYLISKGRRAFETELDRQGRVLVPQILRDSAKLPGDVVVTGNIDHLVVSDRGALAKRLSTEEFGPEDYDELSKLLL